MNIVRQFETTKETQPAPSSPPVGIFRLWQINCYCNAPLNITRLVRGDNLIQKS